MIGYVVNRCNYMGVSMAMGVPQVRWMVWFRENAIVR